MLKVHVHENDLDVEIKFHRARYLVKNGAKCTQLMSTDKIKPGTPMVCDTTCRIQVTDSLEGVFMGTFEGFSRMNPIDVGKYSKVRGRKDSLKRALAAVSLSGCNPLDCRIDKLARTAIWREYHQAFPRK